MSYRKIFTEAYNQVKGVNKKEAVDDHEISMARGELEAIADKATQLASMLQSKSDEGNPLEAWVQSKITKAKDYINSVSDYMMYNPDMKQNEEVKEGIMSNIATLKSEFQRLDTDYKKMKDEYNTIMAGAYKGDEFEVEKKMFKALRSLKDVRQELTSALKTVKEETLEEGFSANLIAKAKEIAKKLSGNLTKAYDEIEKIAKGLSKDTEVQKALRMANEEIDRPNPANPNPKILDEVVSHTVRYTDPRDKVRYAIPYKTHADAEKKMAQLKKDGVKDIKITMDDLKPNIKFKEQLEKKEPKKEKGESTEKLKQDLEKKDDEIAMLKQKAETEKAKQMKKETQKLVNPETGEPLLQVGIAYKHLRDKMKKEEVKLDEDESYGLMGRMSDSQIQNIKKVWAKKTPKDVTQGVKDMIKKMDIPTQLAIKIAKINVLSDLIEDVDLEEKSIRDIFKADKEGESAEEIAKKLKMPLSRVKSILGESHYKPNSHVLVKGKPGQIVKVGTPEVGAYYTVKMNDGQNIQCKAEDITLVEAVTQKEIDKFHTSLDNLVHKHFGHSSDEKKIKKEMFTSNQISDLQKSYADLKGKTISTDKAKALSKHLDRLDVPQLKQLVTANIPFVTNLAKNKLYKKTGKFEGAKSIVESITAVKNKAEKSGMPYSILKQVYDRGMAAWKGGHRPGATQVQWALARVNSFITKSSGTWGGADSDLAKKIKGSN
jgi:hypothetical protein